MKFDFDILDGFGLVQRIRIRCLVNKKLLPRSSSNPVMIGRMEEKSSLISIMGNRMVNILNYNVNIFIHYNIDFKCLIIKFSHLISIVCTFQ